MPSSSEITHLIQRFVEDRDSLEEHEYAQLVEAVKASPELAVQLRDQLVIDDVMSRMLAGDRQRFDAQVQQRIADHIRGEQELNLQADELRSIALARIESGPETRGSWGSFLALAAALSLVGIIAAGVWTWQRQQHSSLVATVESVSGDAIIRRYPSDNDQRAEANLQLRLGDRLILDEEATLALVWSDGTRVELGSGSIADLPAKTKAKRVFLESGELLAQVAKQPSGKPMVFATPHAEAIVRGTEFVLKVSASETSLAVTEGKVELVENETGDSEMVAAAESAVATLGERVAKSSIEFPSSKDGLWYLASGVQRLVREDYKLQPTVIEPQGEGAEFGSGGELLLHGGYFVDELAEGGYGPITNTTVSLELVLAADDFADETRTLVYLGTKETPALVLYQRGRALHLSGVRGVELSDATKVAELSEAGKLTHVAVALNFRMRKFVCTVDGLKHREGALPDEHSVKSDHVTHLYIGGLPDDASYWRGRVVGLAIYDRWVNFDKQ